MRKLALLLVSVLLLSGCAGLSQLRCVVTSCAMTDEQLLGITGKAVPLLSAAADAKQPGASALLAVALNDKQVGSLGVLLPVTPVGQAATRQVVCPGGKWAVACMALPVNQPVKIWVRSLAGSPDLLLLTKID